MRSVQLGDIDMATYSPGAPQGPEYAPGSPQHAANLDPQTGNFQFQPGSVEYAKAYRAEFDRSLSPDERRRLAAVRLADEKAAEEAMVRAAAAEGRVPDGWAVVSHPDATATISVGHRIGDVLFIQTSMLATVMSFGFHPTSFPPRS
jgi:hypothetical protein